MRILSNRLLWKGTSFIAVSSIVVLGLFTFFFSHFISSGVLRKTEDYGKFLLEAVEKGFFQSMIHKDNEYASKTFAEFAGHERINSVAVLNTDGEMAFGVGKKREFWGDVRNILAESGGHTISYEGKENGEHFLVLARSIRNESNCHECHPSGSASLGIIWIELSMEQYDAFNKASYMLLMVMMGGMVLILVVVNVGFFNHFIVRPLEILKSKISDVENGDDGDVVFDSKEGDEIAMLERSFGSMVKKVKEQHNLEIKREKDMALMVQDLKHQMEISAVNKQLANRLKELNQAHKKIKRLAGRLEEKNVNLSKMIKRISALNRLGVALSSELEMDKLIRLVVNVAVRGLRAERGFLMLMDDETMKLKMVYGMGLGEEYDQTLPVDLGESISGSVAENGLPMLIEDMSKQDKYRRISRYGFLRKSVICAPLKVKDRVLGVVELTNKKGEDFFHDEDLEMISSVSAQAAIAIENARLYQKIQKSYFETIRALIQAVEEKDRYTRGHSERVTMFSLKIAEMMGLDQNRLEILKYSGYLHDIGKIGIDINILQKKGKLNNSEYDLVKNHPLIGERIIAPIEFLRKTRNCISQHHERYDGFGYPVGLNGREMSLEARILAVADAYDAMITDRPYRRAFPKKSAIAELMRCSGTQFDPEVVEVFVEVLETDKEILEMEKGLSAVGT